MVDEERDRKTERVALGFAAGWVILSHRTYRRNLLFVLTLVTLIVVFVGSVPLGRTLAERPVMFAFYWIACFVLVGLVLMLAIYDLMKIRRDHRQRMGKLEKELSEATEEARRIAEQEGDNE